MTPHGAAERRDLGETKGNIQLLGCSLGCQLARDTMSNWRCPSSAAYGGVWLWIWRSWDVQLCLPSTCVCVCSGGWQCFYFLMLRHVCWTTWVMLHCRALQDVYSYLCMHRSVEHYRKHSDPWAAAQQREKVPVSLELLSRKNVPCECYIIIQSVLSWIMFPDAVTLYKSSCFNVSKLALQRLVDWETVNRQLFGESIIRFTNVSSKTCQTCAGSSL